MGDAAKKLESSHHMDGRLAALDRSMAVIEFSPDGTIQSANDNFLNTLGYSFDEINGQHHSMFCDRDYAESIPYKQFWQKLAQGEFQSGRYKRLAKDGSEIWIQATYNPILDDKGKVKSVVKFATDVTEETKVGADNKGKVEAIARSQAVIEFNLDGTIIDANDNFLAAVGYGIDEIRGQHHRMFCESEYTSSQDYTDFWLKLGRGEFQAGQYKRITKSGEEIWIDASYNPILDLNGQVKKVVKFASDITETKRLSQRAKIVDLAPVNIMFATAEGKLVYLNEKSRETLGKLKAYLPDSVDNLVGQSIDIFHKHPEHQRKMIADPSNLPHRAKISLGSEKLDLLVSAIYDVDGTYIGPMVTWEVITQKLQMISSLEEAVGHLSSSASELNATAAQMTAASEETNAQANSVATAAEEVAKGVETVTTNTEEMNESIKEIARNANDASTKSNETKLQADATNKTIEQLGSSSQEIGNVIKVISSIAQQTNLLALNATIEAARAGEAGRGFAVVANEVKELAKQTARATEEITDKIGAIQKDSGEAVEAIQAIGTSIESLNGIAGSIAAAVEQQMATTGEVARVVQESNQGVKGISENIQQVSVAAQNTNEGALQLSDAARGLSELAERIQALVADVEV